MKKFITYVAVALGVAGYNVITNADRDDSGAIISEGSVGAFQIREGDCFDHTGDAYSTENGEVSSLPGVPCSAPHDNEVFAVFDVNMASFPGADEMNELVFDTCMERFEPFVGRDYESSALDIMTLYPSEDSWKQKNDREVVCAVYDMDSNKLKGTAKGRGL